MSELGDNNAFANLHPIDIFSLPDMTRLYEEVVYYHIRQARFLLELHMVRKEPCATYIMDYRGLPLAHVRTLCEKLSPEPTKLSILSNGGEKDSVNTAVYGLLEAVNHLNLADEATLLKIVEKICTMVVVDENGLPAEFGPFNLEFELLTAQIGCLKRAIKIQDAILNMFTLRDPSSPDNSLAMVYGCLRTKIYCAARLFFFDSVFHNEGQVLRAVMSFPMKKFHSLTMQREVGPLLQVLLEGKQHANLQKQVTYARSFVMRGPILGQDHNSVAYMRQMDVRLIFEVGRNPCMNEGTVPTGTEYEFFHVPLDGTPPSLSALLAAVGKIKLRIHKKELVYIAYASECAEDVALLSGCVVIGTSARDCNDALDLQGIHYRCEYAVPVMYYKRLFDVERAVFEGHDFESLEVSSDSSSVAANASTGSGEEGFSRERPLSPAIEEQESEAGICREFDSQLPSQGERRDETNSGSEGNTDT